VKPKSTSDAVHALSRYRIICCGRWTWHDDNDFQVCAVCTSVHSSNGHSLLLAIVYGAYRTIDRFRSALLRAAALQATFNLASVGNASCESILIEVCL